MGATKILRSTYVQPHQPHVHIHIVVPYPGTVVEQQNHARSKDTLLSGERE